MKHQFAQLNDVNTVYFDFCKIIGICHLGKNVGNLQISWWALTWWIICQLIC